MNTPANSVCSQLLPARGAARKPASLQRLLQGSSEWEPKTRKSAPTSAAAEEVLRQYLVGKRYKHSTKYFF